MELKSTATSIREFRHNKCQLQTGATIRANYAWHYTKSQNEIIEPAYS
jgi:hypothetical protein